MQLIFTKENIENNKIIKITFGKKTAIEVSLSKPNEVSNEKIVSMLTEIAREISSNNFDWSNDVVTISKEDLGELEDIYNFMHELFHNFYVTYTEEHSKFEEQLNKESDISKNSVEDVI